MEVRMEEGMDFRDVKEAGTTEANNYQVDLDAEQKARMTP